MITSVLLILLTLRICFVEVNPVIKLIATDIDQTLVGAGNYLPESAVAAIHDALAAGIKVVLASGRPLVGMQEYLDKLGIGGSEQYAITHNGAILTRTDGNILTRKMMSYADYVSMTHFGQAHQVPFGVQDANSSVYTADRDIDYVTALQAVENHSSIYCRQPEEMPTSFEVAKADFVGDAARLDAIEPAVRAQYGATHYVTRAGRVFLELMHKDVNKGDALADLAKRLGYRADEVLALGDEENDLPMFAFAGTAIAMGNGRDAVKAAATHVTASLRDDGWAKAVRKYALG